MSNNIAQVDAYLESAEKWQAELSALRKILLSSSLLEDFKWRIPVYVFEGQNVASISALKESCVLSFFKGSLLEDAEGILSKPGENSRAARIIRVTDTKQITKLKPVLKEYLAEAIELEKSGRKVDFDKEADVEVPEDVQRKLDENPALKKAFHALTPGRQRAYLLFFSAAKQSKTRASRVEKYTQRILDGKGLNDCVCGHTQKPPGCDGSHKHF